jgi:hypothetical protein
MAFRTIKQTGRPSRIFRVPAGVLHSRRPQLRCARAEETLAEIDPVTGVAYADQDIRSPLALCVFLFLAQLAR